MIAMKKEEMIKYLRDYASLLYMMMQNQNKKIGDLIGNYNDKIQEENIEYYVKMRRVYSDYILFKKFSIIEDFLLNKDDYLNNNELSGIETDCQIIEAPAGLTNKRIVQLIRNAFNHNKSDEIERFKISVNGKYFEIEFKDIRKESEITAGVITAKPFKIKFNVDYLLKVNKIINQKRQNQFIISFDIPKDFDLYSQDLDKELDKISIMHYYFKRKMPKEVIEEFNKLSSIRGLSNAELQIRSNELHSFAKKISTPDIYKLTPEQKEKVISLITRYKKMYPQLLKDNINIVMYYFLMRVVPVPSFKDQMLTRQLIISSSFMQNLDLSEKEILNRVSLIISGQDKPQNYDEFDCIIHDELSNCNNSFKFGLFNDLLDGEMTVIIPLVMYIDAVVTHYCDEKEITIDNKTYELEKIRNSFVHVRWFIDKNDNLVMYDAEPYNKKVYDLEDVCKIKIDSFVLWADEYVAKKAKRKTK